MTLTGADLPNPWVPYVFLGAALLVTLMTIGVQVRALVAGARAWLSDDRSPSDATILLGGSAGLASIAGTAVAVTVGGPGALVWMWIATVLGMALHYVQARGSAQASDETLYVAGHLGSLGRTLAAVTGLAFIPFAALAGGMLQTQQAAQTLATSTAASPVVTAAVLGAIALPLALSERLRAPLLRFGVPLALLVYCGVALGVAAQDPLLLEFAVGDAIDGAFAFDSAAGGAAGGAVALAAHFGVRQAVLAGELGLGSAMLASRPGRPGHAAGAAAMLVPLLTVSTVATLTALAILAAPIERNPVTEGDPMPLERALSRGLRPSQQAGQTVVLPEESGLEAGKFYAMMLRSNPRGHPFAKLMRKENSILLPQWGISEGVDQVIFRSRDKKLAARGAWDVRVDCNVDVIDGKGGPNFLRLTPTDEKLEFERLFAFYELDAQPFVEVGDFSFTGRVAKASSPDPALGDHLAMYEPPSDDRPFNPKFHEFFRGGFRGPYPHSDEERPPWGWAAREGFDAEPGAIVRLRFEGDPRGEDLVRVNRAGGVEAPPWDLLMRVEELVVRHDSDPSRDIVIPVKPRLDGYRIRLEATDSKWEDFRRVEKMEGFSGPYVRIGHVPFEAEVHSDVRLPDEYAGRRSLVPIHEQSEPLGPLGALPYAPHPGELAAAGVAGPFQAEDGVEIVMTRFEHRFGSAGVWALILTAIVFGLSTVVVYAGYAGRCAAHLGGAWARTPAALAVVGFAMAGGAMTLPVVLGWIDTAMAVVLVPNLLAVALIRSKSAPSTDGSDRPRTVDAASTEADADGADSSGSDHPSSEP